MPDEQIIADLIECIELAIERGDWKVDGACDPDIALARAKQTLKLRGWVENSVDGSYMRAV